MRKWTRFGGGLGAAAVVGLAMTAGPAVAASAATDSAAMSNAVPKATASQAGLFILCAEGGYGVSAVFPDRGGWRTNYVANGTCVAYDMGGSIWEEVDVYDSDTGQYIGNTIYDGVNGETVVTTPGPSFYVIIG